LINLRKNPEQMAWLVLLTAFTTFCLISVSIPLSIYWYTRTATQTLSAELTSVRGIVLYGESSAELTASITDGNSVPFAQTYGAITNDTSQAILTFGDDSSLTMYGNTSIILHTSTTPRFGISPYPSQIIVEVQKGRVRATASRDQADLDFQILTPHAEVQMKQGSYSIEVNPTETQTTTRLGEAQIFSNDGSAITLSQGQRVIAGADGALSPPLPSAQNLLGSTTFDVSFDNSWDIYNITPIESVATTATVVIFQDRTVLNLRGEGKDNVHSEVGVVQAVNKDVRDYQSLRIFAEVRLVNQTLPGGGQLGSEFPVMLHIAYKDAAGNDRDWFHGFYYQPPPDNYILYTQPDNSSERIARFLWYPYESVNVLTSLGPAKPVYIKSIRIYASGWIYDAMVANISLLAEE
jgi:hypothetical protein